MGLLFISLLGLGLLPTAISSHPSASIPQSADEYVVQPYYVIPKDQERFKAYEVAIRKVVVEVQKWYQQKAGVTFRLAPLKVVRSKEDYHTMRCGEKSKRKCKSKKSCRELPNWQAGVRDAIGGWKNRKICWVFAQGGGGWVGGVLYWKHAGLAVFGDWVLEPISGVRNPKSLWTSKEATWQVKGGTPKGTTVHELGHALGLHHPDNYKGKSIMRWHGDYPKTGLLAHEVLILKNSPYCVKNAFDKEAPHCAYETADVAKWNETLLIKGSGFKPGDLVEFVDVKRSWKVEPDSIQGTRIKVKVPRNIGPGFVRILRGKSRSNIVSINFYEKEK